MSILIFVLGVLFIALCIYLCLRKPLTLWGKILSIDIDQSGVSDSIVTVELVSGKIVNLKFDTNNRSNCIHPEDEQCFHGKSKKLAELLNADGFNAMVMLSTCNRTGKIRKVHRLYQALNGLSKK